MRKLTIVLVLALVCSSYVFADDNSGFTDLGQTHWAYESIQALKSMQVISGDQDGRFNPDEFVTREEFAVFISKAFNLAANVNIQPTFSDVPPHRWSYTYVESAKQYMTGYYPYGGKPFYQPEIYASREDIVVALIRALNIDMRNSNYESVDLYELFVDTKEISRNMKPYVQLAVLEGLVSYDESSFKPQAPVTRAEIAVLIHKALKRSNFDQQFSLIVDMPFQVESKYLLITGETNRDATVYVEGFRVHNDEGLFSCIYELGNGPGRYDILIEAKMPDGRVKEHFSNVEYELDDDYFLVNLVEESDVEKVYASGKISDYDSDVSIFVNNKRTFISQPGSWQEELFLEPGNNNFTFKMIDFDGTEYIKDVLVVFTPTAPSIELDYFSDSVTTRTIRLTGRIQDKNDSRPALFINNEKVQVSDGGVFSQEIFLEKGQNDILIEGVNKFGIKSSIDKDVDFEPLDVQIDYFTPPQKTSNAYFTFEFMVTDLSGSEYIVYLNDHQISSRETIRSGAKLIRKFAIPLSFKKGSNVYVISVSSLDGRITSESFEVEFNPVGPQIDLVDYSIRNGIETYNLYVQDEYDSSLVAFINDDKLRHSSIQKVSDHTNIYYYTVEVSAGESIEFTAINDFGVRSHYRLGESDNDN